MLELIEFLARKQNTTFIFLGGLEEKELMQEYQNILKNKIQNVYFKNTANNLNEFIGLLNICNCIITTDSLGLHVALALRKPTLALFCSTLENEIKEEPNLIKLQSPLTDNYFYVNEYYDELANSISVKDVINAMKKLNILKNEVYH